MNRWIIQSVANETGTRGNQTWSGAVPPDGYVWTTEEDIMNVYAPFMGFVDLEIDGDTCTKMTGNQELLDKYKAEHPEPEPPTPKKPEPSTDDVLNALIGCGGQSNATKEEEGK